MFSEIEQKGDQVEITEGLPTKEYYYRQLGANIKATRKKAGLTQAQLCEALSISKSSLSQIENGTQHPSIYLTLQIEFYLEQQPFSLMNAGFQAQVDDFEVLDVSGKTRRTSSNNERFTKIVSKFTQGGQS